MITKYNISYDRIVEFLINNGYSDKLSLHTKINEHYSELIESEFSVDLGIKQSANIILNDTPSFNLKYNLTKENLGLIPKGYSKRIVLKEGDEYSFKDIFGDCFFGAQWIKITDPYVRTLKQVENVKKLIFAIHEFSYVLKNIHLITCWAIQENNKKIDINEALSKLRSNAEYFTYNIENPKCYHDRIIEIDDKYIIDLSRGLDIFQISNKTSFINKESIIHITRKN